MPISLLIEEWGWLIWAGHEQLDVITEALPPSVPSVPNLPKPETQGFDPGCLFFWEKIRPNHLPVLLRYSHPPPK